MYLIDQTYFIKQYFIPNLNELESDVVIELNQFIDQYSRACLKGALGSVLFADFDSYVINGVLEVTAPTKWLNLVNGVTYTLNGVSYTWQGLLKEEGAYKGSLLVPFVYYQWLKDKTSELTGVGEVSIQAKNALTVNSNQRLVTTWNGFLAEYQGYGCGQNQPLVYWKGGTEVIDWQGGDNATGYVTLLQFLRDNEVDYPDFSGLIYQYQNQLGL